MQAGKKSAPEMKISLGLGLRLHIVYYGESYTINRKHQSKAYLSKVLSR